MSSKKNKNITTGTIPITYTPTICHLCGDLLARTYLDSKASPRMLYVMCVDCVKILPEAIQEKLKHPPPLDKLNKEFGVK